MREALGTPPHLKASPTPAFFTQAFAVPVGVSCTQAPDCADRVPVSSSAVTTAARSSDGLLHAFSALSTEGVAGTEHHPNAIVLQSRALRMLFTRVRATETPCAEFVYTSNRLMGVLAEEALAHLPMTKEVQVETPCGVYNGLQPPKSSELAAISIMRAGDSLLRAMRKVIPGIPVGKVLIQRDEATPDKKAIQSYAKLPEGLTEKKAVFLVDPMLATGGSVCRAITELVRAGVQPERIVFVNVVCCPEGLKRLAKEWPQVAVVTAAIDEKLNADKYIVPGLGDFGDRYFGT